jgi:hypothetical protein
MDGKYWSNASWHTNFEFRNIKNRESCCGYVDNIKYFAVYELGPLNKLI